MDEGSTLLLALATRKSKTNKNGLHVVRWKKKIEAREWGSQKNKQG